MENPTTAVTQGTKKALDLQTLVMVLIVTLIIVFVVGKIVKQTVVLKDNAGTVTGTGTVEKQWTWFKKTA
jgi:hypothetical protein